MVLTDSQNKAIITFKKFLEGDTNVFILKGTAGSGKTTLVLEFLKILDAKKHDYALMAPTGRAAYIIGRKTGAQASTIHRCIYGLSGLKTTVSKDDDDSALHLRFGLRQNNDSPSTVYIVDEASMISDSFSENEAFSFGSGCLLTDLFEYAHSRKIIFIGDYAQLPPVGMCFSPALDKVYLEYKFNCKATEVMLHQVLRQAEGSVMLSNASRIRDSIEHKTFIEFKLDNDGDSISENNDLLAPYFQLSPNKPSVKSVVIAYSNKQVLDYNLAIRRHYYGQDAPRLKTGDLLMTCRNNYSFGYELFNGNIVQVAACQPDNEVIQRQVYVKSGNGLTESVVLRFRKTTIRFGVNGEPVSLNVTLLDNFLDEQNGSMNSLLSRALIVDFNNRLPENIKSRHNEIQRLLRRKDRLSTEQKELCEAYVKLLNNDPFYNALICKYGYAITCHKAQGGEWDNVFVDMCRFGGTANEDYFRWAYTALTRASKRIWHYRSPEFNYISNLVIDEIKPSSRIKVSVFAEESGFKEARFSRIQQRTQELGLTVSEDKSKSYQHLITFYDQKLEKATFQLWYNAKGYSAKDTLVSSTSDELTALCSAIIEDSYAPETVPFSAPDRPFAEKLVSFIRSQIDELNIKLLNITQESYQDVFHLKTDGLAQIGLVYTAKGNYTYMRLISSIGDKDTKLQALRERFL